MIKHFYLIILLLFLCSCSNELYNYKKYDDLVYAYSIGEIEEKQAKNLLRQYKEIVTITKEEQRKGKIPPVGACADYGYLLMKIANDKIRAKEDPKQFFLREMELYPESRTYVEKLIKSLGL